MAMRRVSVQYRNLFSHAISLEDGPSKRRGTNLSVQHLLEEIGLKLLVGNAYEDPQWKETDIRLPKMRLVVRLEASSRKAHAPRARQERQEKPRTSTFSTFGRRQM